MPLLTAKSSTIFISTGGDTKVYHSVSDVPVPLRRKLEETTRSQNSATILIADKKGREELVRALQGEPSNVQCRLADSIRNRHTERSLHERRQSNMRTLRRWLEFIIPLAIGGSLWVLIESRF
jgi:hypothetical protein